MENPYQSPMPPGPDSGSAYIHTTLGESGMVRQVKVVAILMFVQGGLQIVMGLYLCGIGVFAMSVFSTMPAGGQRPPPGFPNSAATGMMVLAIYGGLGFLALSAGVLIIYAGIKNLKYRGRTLGIVSLSFGLVTAITCLCAPTAIALAIYGLIVYLNGDVAAAFRLGSEGHSVDQIRSAPVR